MFNQFTFPSRERCLRIGRNALIVFLGGIMIIGGYPGTPGPLQEAFDPYLHAFGVQQSHWHLFSPIPDHVNHRLEARLEYADGAKAEWISPDFRALNDWEHLRYHRLGKYIDNIRDPGYALAWPGLTEYVLKQVAARDGRSERPTRFELRVLEGNVPDARFQPWPPASEPTKLDNRWTLYETEAP